MPAYNSSNFIKEAIASVFNQTYKCWELIIVDDCSTDDTLSILDEYKVDGRVKIISNIINSGNPGLARNVGIEQSTGDYIAFLDSDDIWNPDKLEVQINFMKLNKIDLSFSRYNCINEYGNIINQNIIIPQLISYKNLLKRNYIGLSTAIYNCKNIGKFYFENIGHEDYVYWLTILNSGINAYGINQSLSFYRVHSNSVSSNKIKSAFFTWKILFNHQKLGFFKAVYFFGNYIFFALKKRML
jgi:glycosyltransferase involved in cell wall biosynthesis